MVTNELLIRAYRNMCYAQVMAHTYEQNRSVCKYVHSTSRGHEAIQLAAAFQLLPCDYVSPYYRDESMLLGMGFTPYQLQLQLLAKGADIFSGGRSYYSHPSYKGPDHPQIIHQSSATGMQLIPTTGIAQGIRYLERHLQERLVKGPNGELPIVLCSLGDASITEGEVSEALQFSVLKHLPIIYLVQDNEWGISVSASEARAMDAYEYARGFKGMGRFRIDGSNFIEAYEAMKAVVDYVRENRTPFLVQAKVPLLGHHTSGVRKEFYRPEDDLEEDRKDDPFPKLRNYMRTAGISDEVVHGIEEEAVRRVESDFAAAMAAPDPEPDSVTKYVFKEEARKMGNEETRKRGDEERGGKNEEERKIGNEEAKKPIVMVDAALYAIREIMEDFPEAVLYGQDVGYRLGGVFREAATLADQFGKHRVFNTAIQEAYIIGSTVGMSAVGLKPIVEVQFADYIYPGFNQLVTEISKSCYLSNGKYPVQTLIRVPIGAYGGGGPYHSGSVESTLLSVKGIKVVYPSNAADMKGLMKAAFLDPNPVVMLEHKGLYWSKVPGTEGAKRIEPDKDYIVPLGKAAVVLQADEHAVTNGNSCCIITYGMGVYWALGAAESFPGQIEIVDLRTLYPLDEACVYETVQKHGRCLLLTEEQQSHSFMESLAGRISHACFRYLDAPVEVLGALDLPAVPLNVGLEKEMLPNKERVEAAVRKLIIN